MFVAVFASSGIWGMFRNSSQEPRDNIKIVAAAARLEKSGKSLCGWAGAEGYSQHRSSF